MSSLAFQRRAKYTAHIKRDPPATNGQIGAPEFVMVNIPCWQLDAVDPDLRQSLGIDSPYRLLQTFMEGEYDIRNGDLLVIGGKEYPIVKPDIREWRETQRIHLIVEDRSKKTGSTP